MPRGTPIAPEVVRAVHHMRLTKGLSPSKIAEQFGHGRNWARHIISKFDAETGLALCPRKSGAARKTTAEEDENIVTYVRKNRTQTLKEATQELVKSGQCPNISVSTLHSRIKAAKSRNSKAKKLEKLLKQKDVKILLAQKDYQLQTLELYQANETIQKLQLDNRACSEKLKVRSGTVVRQEVLLKKVRLELENAKAEIASLKIKVEQQEKDISDLNSALLGKGLSHVEARKNLETKTRVIPCTNHRLIVPTGRTVQSSPPSRVVSSVSPGLSNLNTFPLPLASPQRPYALPSDKLLNGIERQISGPAACSPCILPDSEDTDGAHEPSMDADRAESLLV